MNTATLQPGRRTASAAPMTLWNVTSTAPTNGRSKSCSRATSCTRFTLTALHSPGKSRSTLRCPRTSFAVQWLITTIRTPRACERAEQRDRLPYPFSTGIACLKKRAL
nr:MAG TPA: hypothetical protein [Bacteriophage sp.]